MEVLLIPVGFFLLIGGIVIFSAGVSIFRSSGSKADCPQNRPDLSQLGNGNFHITTTSDPSAGAIAKLHS